MIQGGGELRMKPTLNNRMETIKPIITQNISLNSTIYRDEAIMYKNLSKEYNHKTVNHGIGEYVNQDSYTNTIEGVFSHFKRMIIGIYHHIRDKHRFNTRNLSESDRMEMLFIMTSEKLSYKTLIA